MYKYLAAVAIVIIVALQITALTTNYWSTFVNQKKRYNVGLIIGCEEGKCEDINNLMYEPDKDEVKVKERNMITILCIIVSVISLLAALTVLFITGTSRYYSLTTVSLSILLTFIASVLYATGIHKEYPGEPKLAYSYYILIGTIPVLVAASIFCYKAMFEALEEVIPGTENSI